METFINDKKQKLSKAVLNKVEGLSFSAVMKLIRSKDVRINGVRVKDDVQLNAGDTIVVYNKTTTLPEIKIIFDGEDILVVDKPAGILSETLFEKLSSEYGELYFIHRLDRNTSGLMIFAKTKTAETELILGFKKHAFDKRYLATVYGVPKVKEAVLTAYLKKDKESALVKVTDKKIEGSVMIKTGYKVLETYGDTSLLEVILFTGKTHQIRAHLSHIGHFVVGDGKYGDNTFNKKKGKTKQCLRAHVLTLNFDKDSPLFYLDKKTFKAE